ncbi:Peptidase_C1 domain-containing protein/Granulin domain-containing protein/Inhibitor_I29 domain-containing protein [Cephalotus follicularis]|uniref:Peptidase_C1 domain-containing protein/Granulin domain-containing protein/Inhibitor_I29 domain-containing protein n=1 Tax=Cephalotus follicularis TaxID=3775 RepID=A0A1Q3CR93_CEPFO|nr:Peptidase_C1 domain-containing protein/Granulin domain-containing protein/Inhibitor_I29 domain-containing protein [Cephalotus follicularis]
MTTFPPVIFALLLLFSHLSVSSISPISQLFESWCMQHGKTYSSEQEKQHRLKVFEDNYDFVNQHNHHMGSSSYTLALNGFADLTHHEFKADRLGLSAAAGIGFTRQNLGDTGFKGKIPASIDWRKNGAVTNVKDQGSCGACWSFSATGAIEGINKIVTESLVSLSEQELVDCDKTFNDGCGGGLMDYAFQFIKDNHGIDTEEDYPYVGRERSCNKEKLKRHVVTIDGYTDVLPNDENRLLQAVAAQPVSVGICGSERAFQLYSKGIFTGPCSTSLDHAVLIVGYGSENGVDYWIVKNSWGTHWGMNGYIHIQRNSGLSQGVCGINMLASYPIKTGQNPPPSPPPGPTRCNLFTYCSEGETCCCTRHIFGICFSWKCCEVDSAICCKDSRHCCPPDHPVCDTQRNQCLKRTGNTTRIEASEKRGFFNKFSNWSSFLQAWVL